MRVHFESCQIGAIRIAKPKVDKHGITTEEGKALITLEVPISDFQGGQTALIAYVGKAVVATVEGLQLSLDDAATEAEQAELALR